MPTSPPNEFDGLADALHQGLVAGHDQRRADGDAAVRDRRPAPAFRRCRRRAARSRRTPACRRGAAASGRRIRRAACVSPIAARPNTTISQSRSEASSARSMSMRRETRARSNRMVSCGSQPRCAPLSAFREILSCAASVQARDRPFPPPPWSASAGAPSPAAISMSKRSPPATPPAVLTNTAESPSASGEGNRTRSEPDSCNWPRRVTPSSSRTSNRTAPRARLAAKIAEAARCRSASVPRSRAPRAASTYSLQRHLPADLARIEVRAVAGIFHRAAVHDREIVAELAGKVEILLDQHDRDVAEVAQVRRSRGRCP